MMKNNSLYVLDKDEVYHFRVYDKNSRMFRSFFKKNGYPASVLIMDKSKGILDVENPLLFTDGETGEMVSGTVSIEARRAIAAGLRATRLFHEAKRDEGTLKSKLKNYLTAHTPENK